MALPDYTNYSQRSVRQDRRDARQDNRQQNRAVVRDRRRDRRNKGLGQGQYPATTPSASPATYAQPSSGYQGVYTPPANNAQHPFFDPNATQAQQGDQYGGQQWLQPGSPGYNMYGTLNPAAYYTNYLGNRNLGGLDARSQTAQGMYRDWAAGYEAAKFQNPELLFPDFMEMQNIPNLLEQMSEEQIGIDRGRYAGYRDRWGFRGGQ